MYYNWTIIDLYNRSVVASINGKFITSGLAKECMKKALKQQKLKKSFILQSDQGRQFS